MKTHILIAEDELKIADLISKYLDLEGYSSTWARDGLEALKLFKKLSPDLLILDVMMPELDGYRVLESIREDSTVPVIMLTARVEEVDRLLGFSRGADDYVCKPFNPKELVARVQAILRRTAEVEVNNILFNSPITLVKNEHRTLVDETEIRLTQIEFRLLRTLLEKPNRVFTREELLTAIQGSYTEPYERTIDFHIKNLRKKLKIKPTYQFISTVYGVGYKFT